MTFIKQHWVLTLVIAIVGAWYGLSSWVDHQHELAEKEKYHQFDVFHDEIKMRESRRSEEDFYWLQAYYKKSFYGSKTFGSAAEARPTQAEIDTERRHFKEKRERNQAELKTFPDVLKKAMAGDRATIIQFGEGRYGYFGAERARNLALIDLAKKGNAEAQFWAYMNRRVLMDGLPEERARQLAVDNLKDAVRKDHPMAIIYWVNDMFVEGLKNPSLLTLMAQQGDTAFTYLDGMTSGRAMRKDPLDDVQAKRVDQVKPFLEGLAKARAEVVALKGKGLYSDDTIDRTLQVADNAMAEMNKYTNFRMNRNVVGAVIGTKQ